MKSFAIKKGTHAIAVVFHDEKKRTLDRKIIKQNTTYSNEDLLISPGMKFNDNEANKEKKQQWAKQGFYGFKLPKNKYNYELVLVHGIDIDVF